MIHAALGQQRGQCQEGRQCQFDYAFSETIRHDALIPVFYLTTTLTQLVNSPYVPNVTRVTSLLWMRRSPEMDAISEPYLAVVVTRVRMPAAASVNQTHPRGRGYN
jgi:hypothetical protein